MGLKGQKENYMSVEVDNVTSAVHKRPAIQLLTFNEASDALRISPGMLRKLIRNGQLQVVRIGRSVRVPRHEVLRLCEVGTNTEAEL